MGWLAIHLGGEFGYGGALSGAGATGAASSHAGRFAGGPMGVLGYAGGLSGAGAKEAPSFAFGHTVRDGVVPEVGLAPTETAAPVTT